MKYGWIKEKEDKRDLKYKTHRHSINEVKPVLPRSIDLRKPMPPVFDQGELGSCTGNAISGALGYLRYNDPSLEDWYPSRLFIYYHERVLEGTTEEDNGAMIRNGIKVVGKMGAPPEALWPYDLSKWKTDPSEAIDIEAHKYLAMTYYRVDWTDLEEVKGCLAAGFPIVFGFSVFSNLDNVGHGENAVLTMPSAHDKPEGGHAVLLCGYQDDKKLFLVRNSWGCYDEATEVLTHEGFKYFKDINIDIDSFASMDKTGTLIYEKATEYTATQYTGNMLCFNSSKVDLCVTPNHNMYIKTKTDSNYHFIKANDIKQKRFQIKRASLWEGREEATFILPEIISKSNGITSILVPKSDIDMDLFLEFLGYFLSEGSTSRVACKKGGFQYYIKISQTKELNRSIIRSCLNKLPFTFFENEKEFSCSNKQLYVYLQQFGLCDKKFIPKELLSLSKRQLILLYNALMLGDGSTLSNKITYYTTSKQLADDFQVLCLKIGVSSSCYQDDRRGTLSTSGYTYNYICYQIRIQNSYSPNRTPDHMIENTPKIVDYDGNIYCVTVPNHTLFIRRGGKTCWCGNSDWGDGGYFKIPYDYVTDPELSDDFWTLRATT